MSKRLTFILIDIDISAIDRRYNINIQSNINDANCLVNKTNIDELQYSNSKTYSYLDEAKKNKKCAISLCEVVGSSLPNKTDFSCYWCRHPFSTIPIGCPIKKDSEKYIVDGIYCSFNCILAFLDSTRHSMYDNSNMLLSNIYNNLFDSDLASVIPAPSWKLLKEYGGNKSIEEFRDNFNKIEYKNVNNYILELPKQLPVGWLYEEKISF